jgi:DNA-binding response OmpR family regulator
VELARQVQQKSPTVPILFVTGYVDKAALEEFSDDKIIKKPFIGDELAEKINAALPKRFSRLTGKVVLPLRR